MNRELVVEEDTVSIVPHTWCTLPTCSYVNKEHRHHMGIMIKSRDRDFRMNA